jgi:outer membrane lipoprotein-sorting protein
MLPALEARVISAGWAQEQPERFRVEGTLRAPGTPDPVPFLGGSDGDIYYLIDHATKTVYEDLEARVMGSMRRAVLSSLVSELHSPAPFRSELDGPIQELQGTTEVEGESCYQVRVVYDKEGSYEATWYISKEDLLPRRREDTFEMQKGEKGGFQWTIRKLVVNPELEAETFAVTLPEGYTKKNDNAP